MFISSYTPVIPLARSAYGQDDEKPELVEVTKRGAWGVDVTHNINPETTYTKIDANGAHVQLDIDTHRPVPVVKQQDRSFSRGRDWYGVEKD